MFRDEGLAIACENGEGVSGFGIALDRQGELGVAAIPGETLFGELWSRRTDFEPLTSLSRGREEGRAGSWQDPKLSVVCSDVYDFFPLSFLELLRGSLVLVEVINKIILFCHWAFVEVTADHVSLAPVVQ